MAQKVIMGPDGRPHTVVGEDGEKRPAPKRPAPKDAERYFEVARAVHFAEAVVFAKVKGDVHMRLKEARDCVIEGAHVLAQDQLFQKQVWLGPHLFAEVVQAVPPPGFSKIRIHCKEVREQFKIMEMDGYVGLPVMGLAPADVLKQLSFDRRRQKRREKHDAGT